MLSNKVHCDPKKQRNPKMQSNTKSSAIQKAEQYKKQRNTKSSAIQKAAQSKKQRDQMDYNLSSAQKSGTAPNSIVNKKSKGTPDYIQSPPPIIILPTNYIQLQIHPHQHHIRHP